MAVGEEARPRPHSPADSGWRARRGAQPSDGVCDDQGQDSLGPDSPHGRAAGPRRCLRRGHKKGSSALGKKRELLRASRSARACALHTPPPVLRPAGTCAVAASAPARRVGGRAAEGTGASVAAGPGTGALRDGPAAASAAAASLALLVMQPCGGEEAAAGVPPPLAGTDPALPPSGSGGLMLFYELGGPGDGEAEAGEEGEAAGGESTASPEELEEEAAAAGGGAAAAGGGCKSCTYQGCSETTTQVVKQRKPWMCKRHRNKIYKDKYKRKKNDQALGGGGAAAAAGGGPRAEDSVEGSVSVTKQRTGSIGDRPARPTLLEQVLNKKRLSLLRSPEVVQFLQKQQQLLSQQALEQRQQQFQGAPG
ncbi:regulatory factor X-associated protein [Harpia harpyja]|uniref:regulatory factor X-associated protein n=1 Tax=Harpia harpyja TaxID=202280 RepID=UPI0022B137A0|nr:regulatory factor X-associated protein [Harpia harpyja]